MRRLAVARALLALVLVPLLGGAAHAAGEKERARAAYDRGSAAHKRGDFSRAADEFARADDIAPSAVALKAALDESVLADDAALGMTLVDRARTRGPLDDAAKISVELATTRFEHRAGRVRLVCPPTSTCLASFDGRALDAAKPAWARPGQHTLMLTVDGDTEQRLVEVHADELVDIKPRPPGTPPSAVPAPRPLPGESQASRPSASAPAGDAPPPALPPDATPLAAPAPSPGGLSPVWFALGAGLTAVAGGLTIASGLDTASRNRSFVDAGCGTSGGAGCDGMSNDGASAQTRTNVGVAVTAALGVATAVIGIAFTRWKAGGGGAGAGGGGGGARAAIGPGCAAVVVDF